jgi:GAF domain-containing protein
MAPVPDWSERARLAQRLAESALAQDDCLRRLDELTQSVASTLHADLGTLSLSTDRVLTISVWRQPSLVADHPGLNRGAETAFEDTVGVNALRSDGRLVITDARADARISSIPAVDQGLVGAYLGSPLRHDGMNVGMLCVVSGQPRTWTTADIETLDQATSAALAVLIESAPVARPS